MDINKDDEILVSVCVAAYNEEKYIKQCLDSILNQVTNFRFEIIVHDDASTDSTADIIRDFADKYPDVVIPIFEDKNQFTIGNKFMISKCVASARGKYIATLDGDDFWISDGKLQIQYDLIHSKPECVAIFHKVLVYEEGKYTGNSFPDENIFSQTELILESNDFANMIYRNNIFFHSSSYFMNKSMFNVVMSDRSLQNIFDIDYGIIRLALLAGPIIYLKEPMSVYRTSSSSTSITQQKRNESLFWAENQFEIEHRFNQLSNNKYLCYSLRRMLDCIFLTARIDSHIAKNMSKELLSYFGIISIVNSDYDTIKNKIKDIVELIICLCIPSLLKDGKHKVRN